jgi:hypothetical protein
MGRQLKRHLPGVAGWAVSPANRISGGAVAIVAAAIISAMPAVNAVMRRRARSMAHSNLSGPHGKSVTLVFDAEVTLT